MTLGWSIRARLLASMALALLLAAAAVGAVSYRSVLAQTETLFDYQLRQMALSLRDQGEIAPSEAAAFNDQDLDFVIQIWQFDGRQVYASRVPQALPSRAVLGFADLNVDGERWRSYAVQARGRVIQVAQPLRTRQRLAAEAAGRSVLPLLAVAPVIAVAMGWLIERSLRPLYRLAAQVRERDAASLTPLPVADMPAEAEPLVRSLNALLDRLGQALDSQRAFVADAAHELRSPLTALKLQAQLVRRAGDDANRQAALDALVAGVDRATRLVEQLLALARSEPGAPAPSHAPVALGPLLRQVMADLAPLAETRATTLSLEADDAPYTVGGEADALAVLARNLVDNALRYTPPGGQVVVRLVDQPGAVRLIVDDSGPGIPESERERVFSRFVRGRHSAGESGSGLGLAIVRVIAERHRADLTLADSPLGGLRVEVTIPTGAAVSQRA